MSVSKCFPKCIMFTTLAIVLGMASSAQAIVIPPPNIDSFFDIWTEVSVRGDLVYGATVQTTYRGSGGFDTEMVSMQLKSSSLPNVSPPVTLPDPQSLGLPSGTFYVDSFFDLTYEIEISPGSGQFIIDSFFDVEVRIAYEPGVTTESPDGSTTRTWQTEILSMDLSAATPDTNGPPLRLAAGPGHKHRGHVTILKLAEGGEPAASVGGGGTFQVDSFFDVFFEVDVDGGGSFVASTDPTILVIPTLTVPEPTSITMLGLGAVVLMFGAWRRKKK